MNHLQRRHFMMMNQGGGSVVLPTSNIYEYHFEADLGVWSSETDPDNDLVWSNDATARALANTSGAVKVSILNASDQWLTKVLAAPNTSGIWRVRFYFDPNSIVWPNNLDSEIMVLQGGAPAWGEVAIVKFGKNSGGSYVIQSHAQRNAGSYNSSLLNVITDAPHWIEIEVTKSGSGASNGRHRLWIDSLTAPVYDSGTVIDNDEKAGNVQYCYFGVFGGARYQAPGGVVYLDELIVNDNGKPIGA
jgi:hypothetical protein